MLCEKLEPHNLPLLELWQQFLYLVIIHNFLLYLLITIVSILGIYILTLYIYKGICWNISPLLCVRITVFHIKICYAVKPANGGNLSMVESFSRSQEIPPFISIHFYCDFAHFVENRLIVGQIWKIYFVDSYSYYFVQVVIGEFQHLCRYRESYEMVFPVIYNFPDDLVWI